MIENKQTNLRVKLSGKDSNIFNLIAIVDRVLRRNNFKEHSEEMKKRIYASKSYDEALQIFMEYVDVV